MEKSRADKIMRVMFTSSAPRISPQKANAVCKPYFYAGGYKGKGKQAFYIPENKGKACKNSVKRYSFCHFHSTSAKTLLGKHIMLSPFLLIGLWFTHI